MKARRPSNAKRPRTSSQEFELSGMGVVRLRGVYLIHIDHDPEPMRPAGAEDSLAGGSRLVAEFASPSQPPAVSIVLDDVLPAVTPCHDMIDGIGILDPQSSCHHPIESSCRVSFNKKF